MAVRGKASGERGASHNLSRLFAAACGRLTAGEGDEGVSDGRDLDPARGGDAREAVAEGGEGERLRLGGGEGGGAEAVARGRGGEAADEGVSEACGVEEAHDLRHGVSISV